MLVIKVFPKMYFLVFFILAYLVGLINNSFSDLIFNFFFRNNAYCIRHAFLKVKRSTCYPYNRILSSMKIHKMKIIRIYEVCCLRHKRKKSYIKNKIEKRKIICEYYRAYYYVAKNSNNSSISIMECQVVFIRNILLPLFFYIVICRPFKRSLLQPEYYWIFIVFGLLLLIIVMIARQNKIYKRVWEDYVYIKYTNDQEGINGNKN